MNARRIFGIFGAGGFGREVMPLAAQGLKRRSAEGADTGFELVFVESDPERDLVNGYRVVREDEFATWRDAERYFNVAVGSSRARFEIAQRLMGHGCVPFQVHGHTSIIHESSSIGEGATICDNVMITANVEVGSFFQANIYSYVAHDCRIGNYVTFAPRVCCNGNVVVEDFAYIGTGAVIKQGTAKNPIVIGAGATVGMGAVVTKSVPPDTIVVGNPAKPLEKK